ncbi:MAG: hypothetical protein FWE16_01255 [Firmicutes bacterium]|nr:hypothetical protein [Bacillota bacterium]
MTNETRFDYFVEKFDSDFFAIRNGIVKGKYEYLHTSETSNIDQEIHEEAEYEYEDEFSDFQPYKSKLEGTYEDLFADPAERVQKPTQTRIATGTSDAEKLENIRDYTNNASQARYLATHPAEIILANLIMQILSEIEGEQMDDNVIKTLYHEKSVDLEEALEAFEFYHDNPYKEMAQRRLEKIERKRKKR